LPAISYNSFIPELLQICHQFRGICEPFSILPLLGEEEIEVTRFKEEDRQSCR
jgi:hypothetical protein